MVTVKIEAKTYKVVGDFNRAVLIVGRSVASKEQHYRQLLRTRCVDHAHGRPGPERITGEYIASIGIRGPAVGTDDPRGKRLEFGFHQKDSSGRQYDQPPFPHFGPAIDEVRPLFFASIERMVTEALG